jgi:hypothetical protein
MMETNQIDRILVEPSTRQPADHALTVDADDAQALEKTSFYQHGEPSEGSLVPHSDEIHVVRRPHLDLIDFLAVAQWRQIDFFPITWQQTLSSIGIGGTARVKQSLVNLDVSLAFKQLHLDEATASGRTAALQASINEVSVLGHSIIREHPNIIRLEGICWDVKESVVWPVLAFRKATHGNLGDFLSSEPGKRLKFEQRLQICSDIGAAVMTMHAFRMMTAVCESALFC